VAVPTDAHRPGEQVNRPQSVKRMTIGAKGIVNVLTN